MTWLYIPPTLSASVPDTEESTSAYASRWADAVAPSCTANGKRMRRQSWLRKWRRDIWTRLLYGPTLPPFRQEGLLIAWASTPPAPSCTEEFPASHGRRRDNAAALETSAGSGPRSGESPARARWDGSFWKTCGGLFQVTIPALSLCLGTSPKRGGMRNGMCFPRRNAALLMSGNGSSSWPTPVKGDADKNCLKTTYSNGSPHLLAAAAMWATPNVPSGGRVIPNDAKWSGKAAYLKDGTKRQVDLQNQVRFLTGPAVRERSNILGNPRDLWSTPRAHDVNSGKDMKCQGSPSLKTQLGQAGPVKLNPDWAETLMGLPVGWTQAARPCGREEYLRWETASCRLLRQLLGRRYGDG